MRKIMTKKYLTKRSNLGTFYIGDLDGGLSDAISVLEELRDRHADEGFSEVGFDIDPGPGDVCIYVYGFRQETDAERNRRLAKAKKEREVKKEARKKKEAQEIKELEHLLSKHGDKLKGLI